MKTSIKYKLLVTFVLVFIMGLSLSFGFVFNKTTNGNVGYWVFKGITLAFLAVVLIGAWVSKGGFSKIFPLSIIAVLSQILPVFIRIGYTSENPAATIPAIYICSIVLFVMIAFATLMSISHNKFKADEDRAQDSSNAKQ